MPDAFRPNPARNSRLQRAQRETAQEKGIFLLTWGPGKDNTDTGESLRAGGWKPAPFLAPCSSGA
jgi:hypothetical protein